MVNGHWPLTNDHWSSIIIQDNNDHDHHGFVVCTFELNGGFEDLNQVEGGGEPFNHDHDYNKEVAGDDHDHDDNCDDLDHNHGDHNEN